MWIEVSFLLSLLFVLSHGQGDQITPPKDLTMDQIMSRLLGGYSAVAHMRTPDDLILQELDILLTRAQYNAIKGTNRKKRKAVRDTTQLWKNGIVPYAFRPGDFTDAHKYLIKVSMREWEKYTCLRFVERTDESDYVLFSDGSGCSSQLGRTGGVQYLYLASTGCRFKGLYLHEIGHAIGLIHEQQRPDRDEFIEILFGNVQPGLESQFSKYPSDYITSHGITYEFSSVMHYGTTAFSIDGRRQTIRAKPGYEEKEKEIGKVYQKELSFGDVKIVNKMYQCSLSCDDTVTCAFGGYLDQNCVCICPDGTSDCTVGKTNQFPNCRNNYESDWQCSVWAKQGECERRPDFMLAQCERACGVCGDAFAEREDTNGKCENFFTDKKCEGWKANGDCVTNEQWMRQNCKKTCNFCDTQNSRPNTNCMNAHNNDAECKRWALSGECVINPRWMPQNCRSDCHTCENTGSKPMTTPPTVGGRTTQTATRPPTVTTPPTTTSKPKETCRDLYYPTKCAEFEARWKFCNSTYHKMWMEANCMKTCNLCGDGSHGNKGKEKMDTCVDTNKYCKSWADAGHCVINPGFMLRNCTRSCRHCTEGLREAALSQADLFDDTNGNDRNAASKINITNSLLLIITVMTHGCLKYLY